MFADETVTPTGRVAGLGFTAKLGLGTAVAVVGMAGAAAAGVLPDAAQHAVRNAVEAVTPVEFTEPADEHPTNFGERVSNDATGASDGDHGVDGDVISDEAPGAVHRPADPGGSADSGLTRAGETPAASHLPDEVPSAQSDAPGGPSDASAAGPTSTPTTGPASAAASGDHTPPTEPAEPPDERG